MSKGGVEKNKERKEKRKRQDLGYRNHPRPHGTEPRDLEAGLIPAQDGPSPLQ